MDVFLGIKYDPNPSLVTETHSLHIQKFLSFSSLIVYSRKKSGDISEMIRHNIEGQWRSRIFNQNEYAVIFLMVEKGFSDWYYLPNVFGNNCHFFNKVSGDDVKTFDSMFLNFVWTDNRTFCSILLEHLKCFLIVFMQFVYSWIIPVPTVQVHNFRIFINLILYKIQMLRLKSIVNACFVLSDQLPISHRIWNFETNFFIAFSSMFWRP